MTDFLLELRSEEIPARMQEKARADLAQLFAARLEALNLEHAGIESYATPRRLALIVRGVAGTTTAVTEERKGPRADAPAQAVEGFLRSTGLTRDQLVARDDGKGGQVLFAVIERPGLPAPSVLANACQHVVHAFPWPKSMRWGAASQSTESLRWVRPLQGIVALFGDAIVPFEVAGIASGAATVGHRFHHPGAITIGSAADYAEKLRACHVIVDGAERRGIIARGAKMAASKAGLELIEDDGLLFENAGLTEWPVPLLGRFDAAFLDVPPEVIQLTARVNQKYFVCRDGAGKLANAFVCVANIDAADGGAKIVEGNQKVLAARLSDARFFYETDLKIPLRERAEKLTTIVFHQRLGTIADKATRVGNVAANMAGFAKAPAEAKSIVSLAKLAKADLVTAMVGEFPELQGIMGGYYAKAEGLPESAVKAIRDHYLPGGQNGLCPPDSLTQIINAADQLDTIACFFAIGEKPTGSRDPFAVRRSALSLLRLVIEARAGGSMLQMIDWSLLQIGIVAADSAYAQMMARFNFEAEGAATEIEFNSDKRVVEFRGQEFPLPDEIYYPMLLVEIVESQRAELSAEIFAFLIDRLKVQQREAGVRHDLIDAVFALGGEDDLVRLLARVHALQAFVGTEDGRNLLAGYKRAANILKKTPLPSGEEGAHSAQPSGKVRAADASTDHPHPSAPSALPPSPDGRGNERTPPYTPEPAEHALIQALESAEPLAAQAVEREDFEGAMAALSTLRGPIDAFFDQVTVNDADPDKRAARLALLARMRDAVHKVADFSKIEG